MGKKAPKSRQAPSQAPKVPIFPLPHSISKHYGQKGSQIETSSLTSSQSPIFPSTPYHLKTLWAKRLPNRDKIPHKLPKSHFSLYPIPSQNTMGKKAPKSRQAPSQAPKVPIFPLPHTSSKHYGQKASQIETSSLTSSQSPNFPSTPY